MERWSQRQKAFSGLESVWGRDSVAVEPGLRKALLAQSWRKGDRPLSSVKREGMKRWWAHWQKASKVTMSLQVALLPSSAPGRKAEPLSHWGPTKSQRTPMLPALPTTASPFLPSCPTEPTSTQSLLLVGWLLSHSLAERPSFPLLS